MVKQDKVTASEVENTFKKAVESANAETVKKLRAVDLEMSGKVTAQSKIKTEKLAEIRKSRSSQLQTIENEYQKALRQAQSQRDSARSQIETSISSDTDRINAEFTESLKPVEEWYVKAKADVEAEKLQATEAAQAERDRVMKELRPRDEKKTPSGDPAADAPQG